jgi:hypothetical protein
MPTDLAAAWLALSEVHLHDQATDAWFAAGFDPLAESRREDRCDAAACSGKEWEGMVRPKLSIVLVRDATEGWKSASGVVAECAAPGWGGASLPRERR